MVKDLNHIASHVLGQVHVKSSALNPLLWLAALAGVLCFGAADITPAYQGILISVGIVCILSPIPAYAYFAFKDPDRLQSEEYQIKRHQMQLMQGQQSGGIAITEGQLVENPMLKLPSEEQAEVQEMPAEEQVMVQNMSVEEQEK